LRRRLAAADANPLFDAKGNPLPALSIPAK